MNKKFLLTAMLAALGGCSLAPTYHRPELPVSSSWPDTAKPEGKRSMPDWKTYFPDPRLQALIVAAFENNRDLQVATARINEARAQYGIQQSNRLPNVNANVSRTASFTPPSVNFLPIPYEYQRYDVNASLVSFELDFWGRLASLSAAAKANYLSTESAEHAFRLSLIADVSNAYLSLVELEEAAKVAADTTKGRKEVLDLTKRRRELGISSDLDVLAAEGAYQSAVSTDAAIQQQKSAAQNLLTELVGKMPADLPHGLSLEDQGIAPDLIAGMPADVLLKRPDVEAAEQQLIAANANIGAARAAFLPTINLTGALGSASRQIGGLFDAGSKAWNFQPALTLPLFDAGLNRSNLDLAKARKVIAVAQYEKTIQQAFREVADLLNARDTLSRQLDAQKANAQSQKQRLKLTEARFHAGIASNLDLLDAERDADTAMQAELQTRLALLNAATKLYSALAGDTVVKQ